MLEVGIPASTLSDKPALPLGADEFATLMPSLDGIALHAPIGAAVSGGPDSMALAYLLKNWADKNKRPLQAFVVDHALRAESALEAAGTQKRLAALGIPAAILRWEHKGVTSRLHITARRARYELLTNACKNAGISHLFLAHQREDQAETILMRLAKGSGIDGLSGIASASIKNGVRFLRPLLPIAKERLVATCVAAKISFITDPSNASERFARGRLRRILPLLADEGITVDRLVDLGERAATARRALDAYTKDLLACAATYSAYGAITLKHSELMAAPRAIIERALTACLQTIHAADYAPELQSLTQLIDALAGDKTPSRTLHGCLVSRHADIVTIMREHAHITHKAAINPGDTVVWDGRWRVSLTASLAEAAPPYTVQPLGNPSHTIVDKLRTSLRHDVPQGRIRATLPSLWSGQTLVAIPSFVPEKPDDSCFAESVRESICVAFRE